MWSCVTLVAHHLQHLRCRVTCEHGHLARCHHSQPHHAYEGVRAALGNQQAFRQAQVRSSTAAAAAAAAATTCLVGWRTSTERQTALQLQS
jgi:hypothetical protein